MANVGTIRTRSELFQDALREGTLPGILRYRGRAIGDGTPGAIEIFLNAENGSRFYLPTDSCVSGMLVVAAWNVTDGDSPANAVLFFSAENDNGTVGFWPADFYGGADFTANPVIAYTSGIGTITLGADDTNKAIVLNFTPTANDTYEVAGTLYYAFSAADLRGPNFLSATN